MVITLFINGGKRILGMGGGSVRVVNTARIIVVLAVFVTELPVQFENNSHIL